MTGAPATGDAHLVDLAKCFPDQAERDGLLNWAASYLNADCSEDAVTRAASLALEVFEIIRRKNRYRHRSSWQARLAATAFVVAAHRLAIQQRETHVSPDRLN
jgi:hypothetical protein